MNKIQKAVTELLQMNIKTRDELNAAKRVISKKYKLDTLTNAQILAVKTRFITSPYLLRLLRKRAIRTLSGIAPVAVLTKPYPCPGKCAYCPTEKNVPQSYLSNEPAVMRAIRCHYNPYVQVQDRLRALEANGHEPTKIELIVIGGTWSYLPTKYKYWYITECFRAANDFPKNSSKSLPLPAGEGRGEGESPREAGDRVRGERAEARSFPLLTKEGGRGRSAKTLKHQLLLEQTRNEKTKYQIIGLTLETRPDYINEAELWEMRELGCTRVELGVQAIDDKILKINKRGHGVEAIAQATKLLKNFGFKVTYHIMPGLPGSNAKKDFLMFKKLFNDERFQPDQIKFYPTVVTKGSLLYHWWKQGKYKPYSDKVLRNLIIKCKKIVPEYVRIIRLIRDIPAESIEAGNIITNLRQIMQSEGVVCRCIRCREAKNRQQELGNRKKIIIKKYKASSGVEYFISAESKDKKILYGFCRLRLPKPLPESGNPLSGSGIIRELHVYGELVPIGSKKKIQHSGLGKELMNQAEHIAKQNNCAKIAVISGIGVRNYYRKLGYKLNKTYLIKNI